MKDSEYDIICGKCIDENGCDSVAKFSKNSFSLSKNKFSGGFIEATTFTKREVLEKFKFDENLGVGNFHGAEEGFDWIFSILKENKFHAYFETNLKFYHPSVITKMDKKLLLHRVFSYRAGFSYVCLKHKLYFKLFKRIFLVSLAVIYYRLTNPYKFRYYFAEILGILSGIILPPK